MVVWRGGGVGRRKGRRGREREFIETDADACHFSKDGAGRGELFFISAIRAVKLSIVFPASCQRTGAMLLDAFTHTHTHFETIALETLLCQHIGHRLTHICRDQVHYYSHTHTRACTHTPTHTSTQFVFVSPTMIHCGKRLLISLCAGR